MLGSFLAAADDAHTLLEPDGTAAAGVPTVPEYDVWELALPPVPADLREPARLLLERQQDLMNRLEDAMQVIRGQQSTVAEVGPSRPAVFLDRRA